MYVCVRAHTHIYTHMYVQYVHTGTVLFKKLRHSYSFTL